MSTCTNNETLLNGNVIFAAVQHERGPRNSTLRRQQMSNFFNEAREMMMVTPPSATALNLAVPKASTSPLMESPFSMLTPTSYMCNPMLSMPRVSFRNFL